MPRDLLLALAHAHAPAELAGCVRLLTHAIEIGWLGADSLRDLARDLERGHDVVIEELRFSHAGDGAGLEIALLHDAARCDPRALIDWIYGLVAWYPERGHA